MQRIVHLDLKGAPPKVYYLDQVLTVIKSWGATGILLEWEDTFPYSGDLEVIGSSGIGDNMYSLNEVMHIIEFAKRIGLEVVQLVQTIGHMEFVLKHPRYAHLRENARSPAVLCPCKPESQVLVRTMVQQALEVQPDAKYFHIGADEVWYTAQCTECQNRAALNTHKNASLFLEHIRNLTLFMKQMRPNLKILMWDDMMRPMSVDTLKAFQLGELVEPVVWHYNTLETFQLDGNLLNKYKMVFNSLWAGSAYKGANGSCRMISPASYYLSNNKAWMKITQDPPDNHFSGIILTGWSRYDHYSTLCELLPVALPSLASCLKMVTASLHGNYKEEAMIDLLPSHQWPGQGVYNGVLSFIGVSGKCLNFINGDAVTTWLNPWQIENNYTNPVQIDSIAHTAQELLAELAVVQADMTRQLLNVTGPRSTEEWVGTFIQPILGKLTDLFHTAQRRRDAGPGVKPCKNTM